MEWIHLLATLLFALSECKQSIIQESSRHQKLAASGSSSQNRRQHLDFTSPAPHIFASVRDLLQQWPNTFSPNGHSIVPCSIPPFTSLYHGRMDEFAPSSPEWLAFDAEVSYGIMGSSRNSHLMTYQTTRRVQCLYFDGMSAVLAGSGRLDSQMAFLFGNVTRPRKGRDRENGILYDDLIRAQGLCDWIRSKEVGGPGWGIEAIVRMAAGFELIWCDFSSPSLRLISYLNVSVPLNNEPLDLQEPRTGARLGRGYRLDKAQRHYPASVFPLPTLTRSQTPVYDPADPTQAPDWRVISREPFQWSETWQWFTSATWHYGRTGAGPGRGESRVKPATCSFLTYYAPAMSGLRSSTAEKEVQTLNLTHSGRWKGLQGSGRARALQELSRRRRQHTLAAIHPSDAAVMTETAEKVVRNFVREERGDSGDSKCSGVDWMLLANTIGQIYTDSLTELRHILQDWETAIEKGPVATRYWFDVARDHVHSLLLPFFQYPTSDQSDIREDELDISSSSGQAAYARCRFSWTRLLSSDEKVSLSDEEELLKWAVEETVGGICSAILDVGLNVEREWESRYSQSGATDRKRDGPLSRAVRTWLWKVEELIAWLGWTGDHVTCKEVCKWNERCYIPMWPLLDLGEQGLPPTEAPTELKEETLWEPRCLRFTYIARGRNRAV